MQVVISVHHPSTLWQWPSWATDQLRKDFPDIDFVVANEPAALLREIRDATVLVSWQIRPEQLAAAKSLRWIHSPAAAVHQLLSPEVVASPVVVTNGAAVHGSVVAEHALALMLTLARGIAGSVRMQSRSEWGQQQLWERGLSELRGSVALLVGVGHIGSELAVRLKAMQMYVIGVRARPQLGPGGCDEIYAPTELDSLLARADYVVLAAPVTNQTQRMFTRRQFSRMRENSRFINVSRGDLVQEDELIEGLRQGRPGAAALDVFDREPLSAASPLWTMEQVVITPHLGSATGPTWARQLESIEANLRRFLAGQRLLDTVDKQRGY